MSALLRTAGLCAFYGDFQALFGIDFEVATGEVVAIVGANGAGKSTFLKAVCGVLPVPGPQVALGVSWSAFAIFIVVIGGTGTIEGPIVGTLLFFALRELLADHGAWYLIVIGLVAVVTMVAFPRGLWGSLARRYDLRFFPVQRRVHALPSPLAPPEAGRH